MRLHLVTNFRGAVLSGLTRWIVSLSVLLIVSAASAQPCCECRCPGNETRACSEGFGLDETSYSEAVCQPLGCSVAVCTDRACTQSNRCPRSEEGRCADGFDNDADSIVDCDDPDCEEADVCGFPTPGGGGDCCAEHEGTGCEIAACTSCVCEGDAFCCEASWDTTCVTQANGRCADVCPCGGLGTATPTPPSNVTPTEDGTPSSNATPTATVAAGDCCVALDVAGCDASACESCVCDLDSFCCDSTWDVNCASMASLECNEVCECTPPTVTPTPAPPSNCCMGRELEDGPGCSLAGCESCVCNVDSFCCADFWDQSCADIAGAGCLADCGCESAPPLPTNTPTRARPTGPANTPTRVPTIPRIECTSTADCPTGSVCSRTGLCVLPSPTPDESDNRGGDGGGGGCTIQPLTARGAHLAWLVLPLLLRAIGRRRTFR